MFAYLLIRRWSCAFYRCKLQEGVERKGDIAVEASTQTKKHSILNGAFTDEKNNFQFETDWAAEHFRKCQTLC